jgi:hypothetical protein
MPEYQGMKKHALLRFERMKIQAGQASGKKRFSSTSYLQRKKIESLNGILLGIFSIHKNTFCGDRVRDLPLCTNIPAGN